MVFLHCVLICSNMKLNLLAQMSLKTAKHIWANTKNTLEHLKGCQGEPWGVTRAFQDSM